jgi:hypothetical protein
MQTIGSAGRCVLSRESNVVRVDFGRKPDDPPAPRFPGAGALRAEPKEKRIDRVGPAASSIPRRLDREHGKPREHESGNDPAGTFR